MPHTHQPVARLPLPWPPWPTPKRGARDRYQLPKVRGALGAPFGVKSGPAAILENYNGIGSCFGIGAYHTLIKMKPSSSYRI